MTSLRKGIGNCGQVVLRAEDPTNGSTNPRALGCTTSGELYIATSGSVSASLDTHVYGSCSAGWKPIGAKVAEDGSGDYALKVDTELVLSGNITVTNIKGYSTDGTSGSLVYGKADALGNIYVTGSDTNALVSQSIAGNTWASASDAYQKISLATSMFKYQIGVDAGAFSNTAASPTISITGISTLSASTVCPWVLNTTDLTWHYVNLPSVTTASLTVSPNIGTANSSLIIKYNRPELPYSSADNSYQVRVLNPDYSHINGPVTFISESNGAMGLMTSSDLPVVTYDHLTIAMRMSGVSCSFSGTLSTETTVNPLDWYAITNIITASEAGSTILNIEQLNAKYNKIRMNYWKTNATNYCVGRIILH